MSEETTLRKSVTSIQDPSIMAVAQTSTSKSDFRFLGLPAEVRRMIYMLITPHHQNIQLNVATGRRLERQSFAGVPFPRFRDPLTVSSLILVSKQVHFEILPLLYGTNIITLIRGYHNSLSGDFFGDARRLLCHLGQENCRCIKHLVLDFPVEKIDYFPRYKPPAKRFLTRLPNLETMLHQRTDVQEKQDEFYPLFSVFELRYMACVLKYSNHLSRVFWTSRADRGSYPVEIAFTPNKPTLDEPWKNLHGHEIDLEVMWKDAVARYDKDRQQEIGNEISTSQAKIRQMEAELEEAKERHKVVCEGVAAEKQVVAQMLEQGPFKLSARY